MRRWRYSWTICAGCGQIPRLHLDDDGEDLCLWCVFPLADALRASSWNARQAVRRWWRRLRGLPPEPQIIFAVTGMVAFTRAARRVAKAATRAAYAIGKGARS